MTKKRETVAENKTTETDEICNDKMDLFEDTSSQQEADVNNDDNE